MIYEECSVIVPGNCPRNEERGQQRLVGSQINSEEGDLTWSPIFPPEFVDLLVQREDDARLFGQALLYGVLSLDGSSVAMLTGVTSFKLADSSVDTLLTKL